MSFTKDHRSWMKGRPINVYDGREHTLALARSARLNEVIPQTIGSVLCRYRDHPEAKSLAPDGTRCSAATRGLLRRDRVTAGQLSLIGKETDRRWQHGDPSLVDSTILRYRIPKLAVRADRATIARLKKLGLRETMRRSGLSQHTIEKIHAGRAVRPGTLARLIKVIDPRQYYFRSHLTHRQDGAAMASARTANWSIATPINTTSAKGISGLAFGPATRRLLVVAAFRDGTTPLFNV